MNHQKGTINRYNGPSGSGKSTLLNILLRLLPETHGSLKVDGEKLNDFNKKSWYSIVGFVPQNVVLFDGSIEENVKWGIGVDEEKDGRLEEVLKLSNLESVVEKLKDGAHSNWG
ncbi:MAG: ABC transporter ATP-binding protein [Bacteroidetes bacterium]|nr:ABC transporter ATP-binding protein [Bacteroidota bacterium]